MLRAIFAKLGTGIGRSWTRQQLIKFWKVVIRVRAGVRGLGLGLTHEMFVA